MGFGEKNRILKKIEIRGKKIEKGGKEKIKLQKKIEIKVEKGQRKKSQPRMAHG